MKRFLLRIVFLPILVLYGLGVFGQNKNIKSSEFVGPLDYKLPPPPSKEEIMQLELEERLVNFRLELPKLLFKSYLLPFLKKTGDSDQIVAVEVGQNQSLEGWLLLEIDRATQLQNWDYVSDLQNLLACEYFRLGQVEYAFSFFEQALSLKTELKDTDDISLIRFNLASVYEYIGDFTCALSIFSSVLEDSNRKGNKLKQAYALMHMAQVKAKGGSYLEAENDLIQRVLPMFKSLKNRSGEIGRVEAYYTLANVYSLQNRYPETQWFLLQAKEIVNRERYDQWLPDIIFNLAQAKKSSGNYEVAVLEYLEANELAEKQQMIVMQLAVQDALGYIYNESGKFTEALEALNRYDSLKNQVISMEFPD